MDTRLVCLLRRLGTHRLVLCTPPRGSHVNHGLPVLCGGQSGSLRRGEARVLFLVGSCLGSLTPRPLSCDAQNCFELYIPDNKDQVIKACKTEADGRVVEGNHTVYRISAPTPEEKEEWIKCIK